METPAAIAEMGLVDWAKGVRQGELYGQSHGARLIFERGMVEIVQGGDVNQIMARTREQLQKFVIDSAIKYESYEGVSDDEILKDLKRQYEFILDQLYFARVVRGNVSDRGNWYYENGEGSGYGVLLAFGGVLGNKMFPFSDSPEKQERARKLLEAVKKLKYPTLLVVPQNFGVVELGWALKSDEIGANRDASSLLWRPSAYGISFDISPSAYPVEGYRYARPSDVRDGGWRLYVVDGPERSISPDAPDGLTPEGYGNYILRSGFSRISLDAYIIGAYLSYVRGRIWDLNSNSYVMTNVDEGGIGIGYGGYGNFIDGGEKSLVYYIGRDPDEIRGPNSHARNAVRIL